MTTATHPRLTAGIVMTTAIGLIEQNGFDKLSMRSIGDALGIQAASVYWYFDSKEAMLSAVADDLLKMAAEMIEAGARLRTAPADILYEWGQQYRRFLMFHRDAARVLMNHYPAGAGLVQLVEPIGMRLHNAGIVPAVAARAIRTVMLLAQGSAVEAASDQVVAGTDNHLSGAGWVAALREASGGSPFVQKTAYMLASADLVMFREDLTSAVAGFPGFGQN